MALLATVMPALGAFAVAAVAHPLSRLMRAHVAMSLGPYVIAFSVLGGFALVPTYANSFLAGWTFGFVIGFPAVMIALLLAGLISYGLANMLSGHRVEDLIRRHPKWEIVREALIEQSAWRTIWIVALLRLSPILPFETTSVLLAVTGVEVGPFAAGTVLGVIPKTAALVYMASRAHRLDLSQANSRWMLVAGLLLTALGVIVIAVIAKHALERATRNHRDQQAPG